MPASLGRYREQWSTADEEIDHLCHGLDLLATLRMVTLMTNETYLILRVRAPKRDALTDVFIEPYAVIRGSRGGDLAAERVRRPGLSD